MPSQTDRRDAARAYRDRPAQAGIYAIHGPDGATWVGASPDLAAVENRLRFTLKMGDNRTPGLQAAFARAGDAAIRVEILEHLDPKLSPFARRERLKDRAAHWRTRLGAARA